MVGSWRDLTSAVVVKPREDLLELGRLATSSAGTLADGIVEAARACVATLRVGGRVYACGNGGSASDASHFVAELIGRFARERRPLPAVCLNTDPSVVTCIANDYGYEEVFARQVRGLSRLGDCLVVMSTSGQSPNVIAAVDEATRCGVETVALVGRSGLGTEADVVIAVDSISVPRIQEIHTAVLHGICSEIERMMFGG